jgi:hypothetical protein
MIGLHSAENQRSDFFLLMRKVRPMKHLPIIAGTIFIVFTFLGAAMAEPFAALVDIPAELEKGKSGFMSDVSAAQNSKGRIPSREEVGIPAYPGAKILFVQLENRMQENGAWIDLPKRIFMGTPDTSQQVVEFYKKNLIGWEYGEFYKIPTFYKKEGEFKPMEDMITPRIVIAPEFRPRAIMPLSKTTIDIYYSRDQ